jgi:peptidoglycan/LPS O-acetylase OafA/YrhL
VIVDQVSTEPPAAVHDATITVRRSPARLAGMDGLRAFACLTVFLENFHHSMGMTVHGHAGPFDFPYFAESGIGVALLLVLSGALTSLPFWRQLDSGVRAGTWRAFALRRLLRLAPAYYICVALYLLLSGHSPSGSETAAHFLFVNNLREDWFYSISPQFWTIGVFLQLYLAIPLFFVPLRVLRVRGRRAAAIAIALVAGSYLLHAGLMETRHDWFGWPLSEITEPDGLVLSHSALAHLPLFALGIAAGYALSRLSAWHARTVSVPRRCEAIFWICLAGSLLLATVPALASLDLPYGRYLFPWMPLMLAGCIVTIPFTAGARRLFESAPLRALGVVSYGVYVYHMLCMTALVRLIPPVDGPLDKIAFAAIALSLTIAVATASYLAIERPILRWSDVRLRR